MVGESQREVEYPFPVEQAMIGLQEAIGSVGEVLEVSPTLNTVVGRCRYGLQGVKLRIAVIDTGHGTSLVKVWRLAMTSGVELPARAPTRS